MRKKEGEEYPSKENYILKSLRGMKEHVVSGGTASRLVIYPNIGHVCGGEQHPFEVSSKG